ncbi:hypothetical protein D3C72_1915460 [compost metagenome]
MIFQQHGKRHANSKAGQRQGNEDFAFTGTIGQGGNDQHAENGTNVGQHGKPAYLFHIAVGQALQNGGQPQGVAVDPGLVEEVNQDQLPHDPVAQHASQRSIAHRFAFDQQLFVM